MLLSIRAEQYKAILVAAFLLVSICTGCSGTYVMTMTATTVGLEASPGNIQEGQSPTVLFGYKRAETAILPVHKDPGAELKKSDAFSALATFNLALNWFGPAKIEQFIATGHAARLIKTGILRAMVGAVDELARKLQKLMGEDSGSGCWDAIKVWKNTNLPDVKMDVFVNDPKHAGDRKTMSEIVEVKNACLGKL